MSIAAVTAVLEHSAAKHDARLVMLVLAEKASQDGVSWPYRETIARLANIAESTVSRVVRQQQAAGELEVRTSKDGKGERNVYRLSLPGLHAPDYTRLAQHGIVLNEPFTTSQGETCPRPDLVSNSDTGTSHVEPLARVQEERPNRQLEPSQAKDSPGPTEISLIETSRAAGDLFKEQRETEIDELLASTDRLLKMTRAGQNRTPRPSPPGASNPSRPYGRDAARARAKDGSG